MENNQTRNNLAFIDAQNLRYGTTRADEPWDLDLKRFRVYLTMKYGVKEACYFLGAHNTANIQIYEFVRDCGYTVCYREHGNRSMSEKKGNVDTDIVFSILSKIIDEEDFDKVILVSGDGDYWRTVDYLIKKNRFAKLLVPSKNGMSFLYKRISDSYRVRLDDASVKLKIMRRDA